MKNENKNKRRTKSISNKQMVIPIALVIISIIGMVISVGFRTDSIMKTQKKEETEFLSKNINTRKQFTRNIGEEKVSRNHVV